MAAAPRGGVISRRRLLAAGVHERAVDRMLVRGDLYPLYPGVYAVGRPDVPAYGQAWAAILATRGHGPIPHRRALARVSALAADGLVPSPPVPQIVVVGAVLEVPGIEICRTNALPPGDVHLDVARLPWTRWPRALTDLSATCSQIELERYLAAIDAQRRFELAAVDAALGRARGRTGTHRLRRALELYRELSDAEFLSLLERLANHVLVPAGVPQPEINGRVHLLGGASIRVDLLLRDHRLAIEVDGRASHDRKAQFQIDRWRDRELQKLGYVVLRFTWRDVTRDPARFVADILAFLRRGA